MAILKHIAVKNRYYSAAVEYLTCQFDEYTNKPILDDKGRIMEREEYLIEGINCEPDTFGAECIETNRFYGKNNSTRDVKAHHYIISFDPTDAVTLGEAMRFGKEWLSVFAPGHQAVIAAHPDGHNGNKNTHVHIVFNSVRKYGGKQEKWHDKPCEWKQGCKHKSTGKMMHHAKKWVMDKCISWGLEQVDLLAKKHSDNYWVEKRLMKSNSKDGIGATSNKEIIRDTIDRLIPSVDSFEHLVNYLTEIYHWKVRVTNKTVTFTMPDMKQGIRGNKLGEGYGKEELIKRINDMVAQKAKAAEEKRIQAEKEALARAKAIAEEKARQEKIDKENAERIAKIKAEKEAEEKRQKEILDKKKRLAWDKNDTKNQYFYAMVNGEEWNQEYADYLLAIDTKDYASMTIEELSEPVLSRTDYETIQKKELQKNLSDKIQLIWTDVLNNVDGTTHRWKYDYLDYLEELRYRDIGTLTVKELKQPIMTFDEYEQIKDEEHRIEQVSKTELADKCVNEPYVKENYAILEDKEISKKSEGEIGIVSDMSYVEPEYVITEKPKRIQAESISDVVEATESVRKVENVMEVKEEMHRPPTMEEKAEQIAEAFRTLHIPYDDIPAEKKAEIYQFTMSDTDYDLKLHSLVLKKMGLSVYHAEVFEDYREIFEVTEREEKFEKSNHLYQKYKEKIR